MTGRDLFERERNNNGTVLTQVRFSTPEKLKFIPTNKFHVAPIIFVLKLHKLRIPLSFLEQTRKPYCQKRRTWVETVPNIDLSWKWALWTSVGTHRNSKAPTKCKEPRCSVFLWALFNKWVQNILASVGS